MPTDGDSPLRPRVCPYCRESIPFEAFDRHQRGLDLDRLECPHQDIEEAKGNRGPIYYRTDDAW